MSDALILALDIGGTNARGEVVDRDLNVGPSAWLPIPKRDGEATLSTIEALSQMLLGQLTDSERARVQAIGLGVPGIVDSERGIVRLAANLGWLDTPVATELEKRLGLPVILHHDVTVAGLAERERGAGPGAEMNFSQLEAFFAQMRTAFSDYYCERYEIVSSGSLVGCRTEMGGIFDAPFEASPYGTVQPHGRKITLTLINMFRYDDEGKLAEEWVQYDNIEWMRQLGIELTPTRM